MSTYVLFGLSMALSCLAQSSHLSFLTSPTNGQPSVGNKTDVFTDFFVQQGQRLENLENMFLESQRLAGQQAAEIAQLRVKIRDLELKMEEMELKKMPPEKAEESLAIFQDFEDVRSSNPESHSGKYRIDPDGVESGNPPVSVLFEAGTGTTYVTHDSESQMEADRCLDPGCYTRSIIYNATMRQSSQSWRRFFRFDSRTNATPHAWRNDNSGVGRYFWTGSDETAHTCLTPDSLVGTDLSDQGRITKSEDLPVTAVSFEHTSVPSLCGRHTLDQLECTGRVALKRMPKSCRDLWRVDHSPNGFYDVEDDSEIRCELPVNEGMESAIGLVDIENEIYGYANFNGLLLQEEIKPDSCHGCFPE